MRVEMGCPIPTLEDPERNARIERQSVDHERAPTETLQPLDLHSKALACNFLLGAMDVLAQGINESVPPQGFTGIQMNETGFSTSSVVPVAASVAPSSWMENRLIRSDF